MAAVLGVIHSVMQGVVSGVVLSSTIGGTPPTFFILAENGDNLMTEGSDFLIQE